MRFLLTLVFLLLASIAEAQVTFDMAFAEAAVGDDVVFESGTPTIGAGSDRFLICWISSAHGTTVAIPTTVKWGGVGGSDLTKREDISFGGFGILSVWTLVNPAAITSSVYVTWPSNQVYRNINCMSFTGVDPTTPYGTFAEATSAITTPFTATVNVTSVSGDIVVDGFWAIDTNNLSHTVTVGAGQTSRAEQDAAGTRSFGSSTETAAGGSTTMSWTSNNPGTMAGNWAIIGVALKVVGGGPPPAIPAKGMLLGIGGDECEQF